VIPGGGSVAGAELAGARLGLIADGDQIEGPGADVGGGVHDLLRDELEVPGLPALSHLLAVELHLHLTRADLHDDG
jgi:hypothetical protein